MTTTRAQSIAYWLLGVLALLAVLNAGRNGLLGTTTPPPTPLPLPTATPRPPLPGFNPLLRAVVPRPPLPQPPADVALLFSPLYGPSALDQPRWQQRISLAWIAQIIANDGRWLAFAGNDTGPLIVEHVRTGQQWQLTGHPVPFRFLPDSTALLYVVADRERWQLRRFDLQRHTIMVVFESLTATPPKDFVLSQDGQQMTYALPEEPHPQIWLLDLAQGQPTLLYTGFQPTWTTGIGLAPLAWTTQGLIVRQLHAAPPDPYFRTLDHTLLLVNPATGGATQIADRRWPLVAPNGTKVALFDYSSSTMGGVPPGADLAVADLETGQLATGFLAVHGSQGSTIELLHWAPDGQYLLYGTDTSLGSEGMTRLIVARPDGSGQQVIDFDWARAPGILIDAAWIDSAHILCVTHEATSNTQHVFQLALNSFTLDQREAPASVPILDETAAAWREQVVYIRTPIP